MKCCKKMPFEKLQFQKSAVREIQAGLPFRRIMMINECFSKEMQREEVCGQIRSLYGDILESPLFLGEKNDEKQRLPIDMVGKRDYTPH